MKAHIKTLQWYDIALLTIILIGNGIYTSTLYFVQLSNQSNAFFFQVYEFTESDNYSGLVLQFVLLLIALVYLKWRNFDFTSWQIRLTKKGIVQGLVLFIISALCMDILYLLTYYATSYYSAYKILPSIAIERMMSITPLVILYALLNGVYEELYFLGICLAVPHIHLLKAFSFSLIIRFAFHTYMGIYTAVSIALILGILHFIVYTKSKDKNLFPYFLAHSIADVFGLTVLSYIFY